MKTITIVLSLLLSGCAAMALSQEYPGVRHQTVTVGKRPFWVFQHPNPERVWVQDTPGGAFWKGIGEGLTLGALDTNELQRVYREALDVYLQQKSRTCSVVSAQSVPDAGWEFTLDCATSHSPQTSPSSG